MVHRNALDRTAMTLSNDDKIEEKYSIRCLLESTSFHKSLILNKCCLNGLNPDVCLCWFERNSSKVFFGFTLTPWRLLISAETQTNYLSILLEGF